MAGLIDIDLHEVAELVMALAALADRPKREAQARYREAGEELGSRARANAGSWFTKASTGSAAAGVTVEVAADGAHVYSVDRGGFFQEYGSPNTGPPHRWLTGPAEDVATEMGEKFATDIEGGW